MPSESALPLLRALPMDDPFAALEALSSLPHAFLLHSAREDGRAQWSYFGADPFAVFRGDAHSEAVATWRRYAARIGDGAPAATVVPFTGGLVGYWAYDFGRRLERVPSFAVDDLHLPDAVLGLYDVVGAFHHPSRQAFVCASGLPFEGAEQLAHAGRRLDAFVRRLEAPRARVAHALRHPGPARATHTADDYRRGVEAVIEHIRRGDLFQANLSQRWTLPLDAGAPAPLALALHRALARLSPAPHAAFFDAGDHALASASPERFLELRGGRIETRPIKGTRPRGADPVEDARLGAELLASAKDRAENIMIVDVLRNDLGRVAETGTVRAERLCELEAFPQVFHLTSTVSAALRPGLDAFDLLHACFPGGSITGAPKIRAMEIIDRLEPVRRHAYTGAIGYVDWRGDADWNVAIRTATVTPDALHFSAGGGITGESDPDAEYRESLDKAAGLRAAVAEVLGVEALARERVGAR